MTQYALVTGCARRIGAEIARGLHAAGYHVVLHSHASDPSALRAELEARRAGSTTVAPVDLLAMEARATWLDSLLNELPRLDLLVNNASVFIADEGLSDDARRQQYELNAEVPFELCHALRPLLLKGDDPSIVNIADIHASAPLKGYSHYCASKAALLAYSKQLMKSLAPEIRVNVVSPGAIMWPEDSNELSDAHKQKIIAKTPLGRSGAASDIARAVLAFATLPFVTGQNLAVDGGRSGTGN